NLRLTACACAVSSQKGNTSYSRAASAFRPFYHRIKLRGGMHDSGFGYATEACARQARLAAGENDMATMHPGETAYFEGAFISSAEAKLSVMTHAFNYGTALFEGIRGYYSKEEENLF